jgi:hypothetical protein
MRIGDQIREAGSRWRPRRGAVVVVVIVCLVVITLLCGALLRTGLARRAQVRSEERRLQADWLAESGLERAAARLASDAGYAGETWELSPKDLDGVAPGVVRIVVEPLEGRPRGRRVRVQADYPRDPPLRARRSRHWVVELGTVTGGDAP